MSEVYKLLFRAEVLDGQHKAVVKKRLSEAMKLSDAQAERLFTGDPVVIKKLANKELAARYQAVFKKAGARLRVVPLASATESDGTARAATPSGDEVSMATSADTLTLMPLGNVLDRRNLSL